MQSKFNLVNALITTILQENSAQQFPFQNSRSTKNTKLADRDGNKAQDTQLLWHFIPTCDCVNFFSSCSSRSVFCNRNLIICNSSSKSFFSFSVMPCFVSMVTAPTDLTGGTVEITIPLTWLVCSPCRLLR